MPAQTTPIKSTTAETPVKISGVTTKAREARAAEELPPSEETLSIMPTAADLFGPLGLKRPKAAATAESEEMTDEETEEAETEEESEAESEEETEEVTSDATEEETTEETDAEQESEAESEEETTEEEDEDATTPEAKTVKASMQKRINKLTAQKTDLQTQLDDLQNQLTEAKAGPAPKGDARNPLAHVITAEQLKETVRTARAVKDWALRNRNGGEVPLGEGKVKAYDAQEVAEMLANAEAELDAVPERQGWLEAQSKAEEMGKQYAPNFFTKGTEHYRALEKAMAELPPAVRAWRPDIKLIIMQAIVGSAVLGDQARKGKKGADAGTDPKKKPVVSAKKVPTTPTARPATKAPIKVIEARKATEALRKPGGATERGLARALEARLG